MSAPHCRPANCPSPTPATLCKTLEGGGVVFCLASYIEWLILEPFYKYNPPFLGCFLGRHPGTGLKVALFLLF